jgi:hypothetical protein
LINFVGYEEVDQIEISLGRIQLGCHVKFSLVLLLLLPCIAYGAFMSEVSFLGFSPDGRYAAFGQHWVEDGSGFPGAQIQVMSVSDGSVTRVFEERWDEEIVYSDDDWEMPEHGEATIWSEVQDQAGSFLDSLGISSDNTGWHCLSHLPTDTGCDPWRAVFSTWIWAPGFMGPEYHLSLLLHPVSTEDQPDWLEMFAEPVMLELFIEDGDGYRVMHHADTSPVDGYEYASDYRIRDVYVCRDSMVAIILITVEPGFEGPDGMHRMITGVMDIGPGSGY